MKYMEALKLWNAQHNPGKWCLVKKGTPEYDEVKKIQGVPEKGQRKAKEKKVIERPFVIEGGAPVLSEEQVKATVKARAKAAREAKLAPARASVKREKVKAFLGKMLEKRRAAKAAKAAAEAAAKAAPKKKAIKILEGELNLDEEPSSSKLSATAIVLKRDELIKELRALPGSMTILTEMYRPQMKTTESDKYSWWRPQDAGLVGKTQIDFNKPPQLSPDQVAKIVEDYLPAKAVLEATLTTYRKEKGSLKQLELLRLKRLTDQEEGAKKKVEPVKAEAKSEAGAGAGAGKEMKGKHRVQTTKEEREAQKKALAHIGRGKRDEIISKLKEVKLPHIYAQLLSSDPYYSHLKKLTPEPHKYTVEELIKFLKENADADQIVSGANAQSVFNLAIFDKPDVAATKVQKAGEAKAEAPKAAYPAHYTKEMIELIEKGKAEQKAKAEEEARKLKEKEEKKQAKKKEREAAKVAGAPGKYDLLRKMEAVGLRQGGIKNYHPEHDLITREALGYLLEQVGEPTYRVQIHNPGDKSSPTQILSASQIVKSLPGNRKISPGYANSLLHIYIRSKAYEQYAKDEKTMSSKEFDKKYRTSEGYWNQKALDAFNVRDY